MKVSVGISNRHVHLKKEDLRTLFGKDFELTKKKDINQPGQYAANELVTICGPKGAIENVRILGPVRPYTQIEISRTDSFKLGVNPPVRMSGDLENSEEITIIGPKGQIKTNGCILAARHIHVTNEELIKYGLSENKEYKVAINNEKNTILGSVFVKASEKAYYELHLDTDDANACMLKNGDEVELIIDEK